MKKNSPLFAAFATGCGLSWPNSPRWDINETANSDFSSSRGHHHRGCADDGLAGSENDLSRYRLRPRCSGSRESHLPNLVGIHGMDLDGPCHHFSGLACDLEYFAPSLLPREDRRCGFTGARKSETG